MNRLLTIRGCTVALLLSAVVGLFPGIAAATIPGFTGASPNPSFDLYAKADFITTSDGDSLYMWGYAFGSGNRMQYPGPTIIVNQGDAVTINLYNQLPLPVSIVFPGQTVSASGGVQGLLAMEVAAVDTLGATTGPVTYTFTASQPGTYIYYSGTRPDLEVEMGLAGTIIVRPAGYNANATTHQVYNDATTSYEREYLFFMNEADPDIHARVALASGTIAQRQAQIAAIDTTKRHAVDWFLNGRNMPDTMADATPASDGFYPTQPYNCLPMATPGERVLLRMVSAGMDFHPLHTHGQNHLVVAREGRLLSTDGATADLAVSDYTTSSIPGETVDAIWGPWTGAQLGWDAYGPPGGIPELNVPPHTCNGNATPNPPTFAGNFDPVTHEYCPDHGKPIPVALPSDSNVTFGNFALYSGSPYLGVTVDKPPLNPGSSPLTNTLGAMTYMWHSHDERELTTNDIFPGGMGTMFMLVPVGTPIP